MLTKIICEDKQFNPIIIYSDINPDTKQPNLEYRLKFTKVSVSKPIINETNGKEKPLTPNEARLRNFPYCSNIYVDVEHQIRRKDNENKWDEPNKTTVCNDVEANKCMGPVSLPIAYFAKALI